MLLLQNPGMSDMYKSSMLTCTGNLEVVHGCSYQHFCFAAANENCFYETSPCLQCSCCMHMLCMWLKHP